MTWEELNEQLGPIFRAPDTPEEIENKKQMFYELMCLEAINGCPIERCLNENTPK